MLRWLLHPRGGCTIRRVDVAQLLEDLAHVPPLPGALCRDRRDLFDAAVGSAVSRAATWQARREAIQCCRACPALEACRDWVESLPPYIRPWGVTAGRVQAQQQPRPPGTSRHTTKHW